ncbi:MAG: cytochrome c-552 precursor [Gammaproteobacteria bacterium]|nr:MAG: cytochrome c-552 precursor [Gammaproteobacteria bacterium]
MKATKLFIGSLILFCFSLSVDAIDWNKVKAKQVTLFYPGQSSWEWILTKNDHGGAKNFRKGKGCRECHQGEEQDMGNLLVSGKRLEPDPIPGKRGFVNVAVKTAYDDKKFYIQLVWAETTEAALTKLTNNQTRVTFLFDDGSVSSVSRGGCWAACHDDANNMPSAQAAKDLHLYLAKSRTKITRKGGGENYKSTEALDQLLAEGVFVEYWQAQLNDGQVTGTLDAYILDKHHDNKHPLAAIAELKNGVWTVEMSRELSNPDTLHYKNIVPGKGYGFGLAIHDAYSEGRRHLVSFGHSFVLDQGAADFIVVKQ